MKSQVTVMTCGEEVKGGMGSKVSGAGEPLVVNLHRRLKKKSERGYIDKKRKI